MPDMTLGPVAQIARTVKDIAAARRWYGEVLGLPHLYSFGNLAFYDCGGVRLFLSEGEGAPSESILYFPTPNALRQVRPSTRPWFETARNFVLFGNESGAYDDLMAYMKTKKLL